MGNQVKPVRHLLASIRHGWLHCVGYALLPHAPCRTLGDARICNPEFILKVALEWGIWVHGTYQEVVFRMFDVCVVHQTSWIWCPCSWFPPQRTWIWPGWADGLERNCLWAVSSLFPLDGLERRSSRDIWASSELCSFCRLCCWGPGSCRIIHILVFQSLCQSTTWWGLCLVCCERTGLVPWPWGDVDLWLCGSVEVFFLFSLEFN